MTAYARSERAGLAMLLAESGPDAPTLCAGWTTADLAAHLVVRDRRPDSGPGLVVPAFAGWTEAVRRAAVTSGGYADLVADVVRPPWWSPVSNPLLHEAVNLVEFFVHHEDVRRAVPGWTRRELPDGMEPALWRRLGTLRLLLRRFPARVILDAPGHGELRAGRGGDAEVRVTGAPSELVLFCSGRQRVADVVLDGPPAVVERLRTARFGL